MTRLFLKAPTCAKSQLRLDGPMMLKGGVGYASSSRGRRKTGIGPTECCITLDEGLILEPWDSLLIERLLLSNRAARRELLEQRLAAAVACLIADRTSVIQMGNPSALTFSRYSWSQAKFCSGRDQLFSPSQAGGGGRLTSARSYQCTAAAEILHPAHSLTKRLSQSMPSSVPVTAGETSFAFEANGSISFFQSLTAEATSMLDCEARSGSFLLSERRRRRRPARR